MKLRRSKVKVRIRGPIVVDGQLAWCPICKFPRMWFDTVEEASEWHRDHWSSCHTTDDISPDEDVQR